MSPQFLQGFPSSRHLSLLVLCMTDTKEAHLQLVLMHAHTCVHAVSPFSVSLSGDKTSKSFRLPPRYCTVRPRSLVDRGTEAPSLHGTSTRGHSHHRYPRASDGSIRQRGRTDGPSQSRFPPAATQREPYPTACAAQATRLPASPTSYKCVAQLAPVLQAREVGRTLTITFRIQWRSYGATIVLAAF